MVELRKIKQQLNNFMLILRGKDSQNTSPFKASSKAACRKTLHFGFSLAEVLVAMLIMSIFYLATAKTLTIRQKPQTQENPHGYYECYTRDGLKNRRVDNGSVTIEERDVNSCIFQPIKGLPFYNIYIVTAQGFYTNPEAQMNFDDNNDNNDNNIIRIGTPQGLLNDYRQLEESLGRSIDEIMADHREEKLIQFRGYVHTTHPESMLARNWNMDNISPPYAEVLIVW